MVETHAGNRQKNPRYWGFAEPAPQVGGCDHGSARFDARPRRGLCHTLRGGRFAIGQGQESRARHAAADARTGNGQPHQPCLPGAPSQGRPAAATTQCRSTPAACNGQKDRPRPGCVRTLLSDGGHLRQHLPGPAPDTHRHLDPKHTARTGRRARYRCVVRRPRATADALVRPVEAIGYPRLAPAGAPGPSETVAATDRLRARSDRGVQIQGVRP